MLRSTIIQDDIPIYTAAWGSDSNQVLIAQGRTLVIKPLAPNTRPTRVGLSKSINLLFRWFKKGLTSKFYIFTVESARRFNIKSRLESE